MGTTTPIAAFDPVDRPPLCGEIAPVEVSDAPWLVEAECDSVGVSLLLVFVLISVLVVVLQTLVVEDVLLLVISRVEEDGDGAIRVVEVLADEQDGEVSTLMFAAEHRALVYSMDAAHHVSLT
jgi:hypothetical protein